MRLWRYVGNSTADPYVPILDGLTTSTAAVAVAVIVSIFEAADGEAGVLSSARSLADGGVVAGEAILEARALRTGLLLQRREAEPKALANREAGCVSAACRGPPLDASDGIAEANAGAFEVVKSFNTDRPFDTLPEGANVDVAAVIF